MKKIITGFIVIAVCSTSFAMDKSKTIYKCMEGKKVIYTDEPCIGGTVPEIVPTQGLDKATGKSLKGKDVQAIEHREMWVDNFMNPAFGIGRGQYKVMTERQKLPPKDKDECYQLDSKLIANQDAEKKAVGKAAIDKAQLELYVTRKRFKDLKC
jgi:hypothetical protein